MITSLLFAIVELIGERRRQEALQRTLAGAGGSFSRDEAARRQAFKRIGLLDTLPTGEKGVAWCGELRGTELLEHRYTAGSLGRWRSIRRRTIASVPVPQDWPPLVVSSEHQLYLIDTTGRRNAMKLENARFNKRWRAQAHDENFALVFLTRDVQEWFMNLPKGAIVHVGLGVLSVSVERVARPETILGFASLPSELLGKLCPELKTEMDAGAIRAAA